MGADQGDNKATGNEKVLFGVFVYCVLALVPNIVATALANSLVLYLDLITAIIEALSLMLAWLTVRSINRSSGAYYDFGFGKVESLASFVVGSLMLLSVFVILFGAYYGIMHPAPLEGYGFALVFNIAAAVFCFSLWRYYSKANKVSPSSIIESQAQGFRVSFVTTLFVTLSLCLNWMFSGHAWVLYVDPVAAILYSIFQLHAAYAILTHSMYDLTDKAIEEPIQMIIVQELVKYFDEYKQLHDVQTRRSGSKVHINLFLEFEPQVTMEHAQSVIGNIKASIENRIQSSRVLVILSASPEK